MNLREYILNNPEEFMHRYDDKSKLYIKEHLLANNNISFKKHCNCGACHNDKIVHQDYCLQYQEVLEWTKMHEHTQ